MPSNEFVATVDETIELTTRASDVTTTDAEPDTVTVTVGDREMTVRLGPWQSQHLRTAWIDGTRSTFAWRRDRDGIVQLHLDGVAYGIELVDAMTNKLRALKAATTGGQDIKLKALMPGIVVSVNVTVGAAVKAGDVICILEAMKMQNEIRATAAGIVKELHVAPGQSVQKNAPLAVLAPPE